MNQAPFRRNHLYLPLALLTMLVSACGSGSSADQPNNNGQPVLSTQNPANSPIVTPNQVAPANVNNSLNSNTILPINTNAQQYEDAFVKLSYPEGWTLDTSQTNITARFIEPGLNETRGINSCGLISSAIPGSTLIEGTDSFLETYIDTPGPQTSFINVNGTEMSRIEGMISHSSGVPIDASTQIAYKDPMAHVLHCAGVSPENVTLIFNSMVIR